MIRRWRRRAWRCPKGLVSAVAERGGVLLSGLRSGEQGVVVGMDGGRGLLCRMTSLGFTPGAEVTVLQNFGRGPLIVRVRDARIALGRGEAGHIRVHKELS